jgi:sec-independent protein translocase protein TatA
MGSDLFAPWHIIILVVVLVVLFGAKRLPGAASSLGKSMHIFRDSVRGLSGDDTDSAASPAGFSTTGPAMTTPLVTAPPAAVAAPDVTQPQLQDLQRQVQELQRQSAANGTSQASEAQTSQPI